jgi:hypothetical protein
MVPGSPEKDDNNGMLLIVADGCRLSMHPEPLSQRDWEVEFVEGTSFTCPHGFSFVVGEDAFVDVENER